MHPYIVNKDQPLPTTRREPAGTLDDIAAGWVARLDRGLTEPERAELEKWLAGNARRQGALARAKAIWLHADRVASLGPALSTTDGTSAPEQKRWSIGMSRRSLLAAGSAIAASLVAGVVTAPRLLGYGKRLSSNVGEIRRVPLGDGSMVTLDTDSLIETSFSTEARHVRLISGLAYFEVAHDRARPFLVHARDVTVRVIGTAFSVRALAGTPIAVIVSQGHVAISHRTANGPTLNLTPNMRADLLDAPAPGAAIGAVASVEPDALQRALAWRDGMLAFEGETLADAALRFRRYGGPAIEIQSQALARQPISGLFSASDPRGFARAIAVSLDATVQENGGTIQLMESRPQ